MSDHRDKAFDALGQVLRIYAEHTFDVEQDPASESKERFKLWARHLLTGSAHPSTPSEGPAKKRDFGGLRKELTRHREAEKAHVDQLVGAVWQMLSGLHTAFAEDRQDDVQVAAQLDKLKGTARGSDVAALRTECVKTVVHVQRSLEKRRERHKVAMSDMGNKLRSLKTELADARHKAETDGLTDLYNRASFDEHTFAAVQLAEFTGEALSLLMVDVDHFKVLNDTHGHPKGDEALIGIANAIVRVASRRTDFVARYGGEEIVVVLGDTPLGGAVKVAERVCASIRKVKLKGREGKRIKVTASIGVASLKAGEKVASMLERADRALYVAKEGGRDRWATEDDLDEE